VPERIGRVQLEQRAELLDGLLRILDLKIIPAARPVFFPVRHAIAFLHRQFVGSDRIPALAQVGVHRSQPGVGGSEIGVQLDGLEVRFPCE
jgi:hypothetical protein